MPNLVLALRPNEAIVLQTSDGEIIFTRIHNDAGGGVKVGIEAPRSVSITRRQQQEARR